MSNSMDNLSPFLTSFQGATLDSSGINLSLFLSLLKLCWTGQRIASASPGGPVYQDIVTFF